MGCPITRHTLHPNGRSELGHHPLRDVDASTALFLLDFVVVGPASTSGFTIGMFLAAGLSSTSTRPSCKLQGFQSIPSSMSRFQRSSLFLLRMLVAHGVVSRPRGET